MTICVHCNFKLKTVLYRIFLSAFAHFTGVLVRNIRIYYECEVGIEISEISVTTTLWL